MTTPAIKTTQNHPPLAIDSNGNPIRLPDGTTSWRICIKTTGRPREILDDNKQIVRFPLSVTGEQLAEHYGRNVYRVYALDEIGELLDHVTTLDLTGGELRNAPTSEPTLPTLRSSSPPGTGASSDLRFALEAMTQMMKTNSDALRIVTDSHVDLAKTIAVAKGLPRNAIMVAPPAASVRDEDDDEDNDYAEQYDAAPKTWADVAHTVAEQFGPMVPAVLAQMQAKRASASDESSGSDRSDNAPTGAEPSANENAPAAGEMTAEEMELAGKPRWEMREFIDLNYARRKFDAKRKAAALKARVAPTEAAQAPAGGIQARVMSDPALMQKLIAIKAQLTQAEVDRLMAAIAQMSEQQQTHLLRMLKAAPEEAAVAACRELLESLSESAKQSHPISESANQ